MAAARPATVAARRQAAATGHASRPAHAPRPVRAPRGPRRISGPARPKHAAPAGRFAAGAAVTVPASGVAGRLRALPDSRFLDRLLRSRLWIWIIGIGLGGIVAMQVSLLKLNTGISRAVQASGTLERSNAQLEKEVAELSSGVRVRTAATGQGMVLPAAGSVGYLTVRPGYDVKRALARMTAPSEQALQVMASGGRAPGSLIATPAMGTTATAPVTTTTAAPSATAAPAATTPTAPATAQNQPAPEATAAPAPAATPAPATTPAPAATQPGAPQTSAAGATGAAAAPAG